MAPARPFAAVAPGGSDPDAQVPLCAPSTLPVAIPSAWSGGDSAGARRWST